MPAARLAVVGPHRFACRCCRRPAAGGPPSAIGVYEVAIIIEIRSEPDQVDAAAPAVGGNSIRRQSGTPAIGVAAADCIHAPD